MAKRVSSKSARIASRLRAEIVAGHLLPGDSLPTWDAMETQFSAGRPTLTRAMAQLKEDGFIQATRSKGTFVHDRPPHLTRFGLVFPSHPSIAYTGLGRWNRFWDMLSLMAPVVGDQLDLEMPVYYNIGSGLGKDEERLRKDLLHRRLGGLIVVGADTTRHPFLQEGSRPMIAVHSRAEDVDCPCIYVDRRDFVEKSLQMLTKHGRQRVAVLSDRYFAFRLDREPIVRMGRENVSWQEVNQRFVAFMQERGFNSKPHWHLMLTPSSARNTVRLMFEHAEDRPDGLIICDDNLVEEALAGLIGAGVTSTEALTVITHCNWPAATHPLFSTIGLGFDIPDFLRLCIHSLQRLQSGETLPHMQFINAQSSPSPVPLAVRSPVLTD